MTGRSPASIAFLLIFLSLPFYGQQDPDVFPKRIEALITQDSAQIADQLLDQEIGKATSNGDYMLLSQLVYWLGKVEMETNVEKSFPRAIDLSKRIIANSSDEPILFLTYLDLSRLYNEKGNATKAYEIATLGKAHAINKKDDQMLAEIHYYLGEYGLRSGNIETFEKNTREAYGILQKNPEREFKISARILNYMGALMYLTGKLDSAFVYYEKALEKVGAMERNPENQLYFPAAIKANMVLLKQNQNKYDEAMVLAQECIALNNAFLDSSKKHPLRYRAQRNLSLAYRNLASLYEQVGDYEKLYRIAKLTYTHAKANFRPELMEYFSAITLLAEAEISRKEFGSAIEILKEAERSIDLMGGDNPLLSANLHTIIGGAYFGKKNYEKAKEYYLKGMRFHKKAQTQLSSDGLFATINLALSFAQSGEKENAINVLKDAYNIQDKSKSGSKRLANVLLVSMARIADLTNDFDESLKWSAKFIAENKEESNAAVDPLLAEAILWNTKARYHLETDRDIPFLEDLNKSIKNVISILEKRKAMITSQKNVNDLIQDNNEAFEFAKKLNLELYEKTGDDHFLDNLLSFHESSIYSRIRARLNLKQSSSFSRLPEKIQKRETLLKENLTADGEGTIETFLENLKSWNQFLDTLNHDQPDYFKMRYATIAEPLDNLQQSIGKDITVVRYFFVEDKLLALVANSTGKKLVRLPYRSTASEIQKLSSPKSDLIEMAKASHFLYQHLWEPIKSAVKTERVIIIPDRELFNLNFELLTPTKIKDFSEFGSNSLLAQHIISYNYSLLLLHNKESKNDYTDSFVAFAPEFNQKMKQDYEMAITDSIHLDKTYLTLLPQPFSLDLAQEYSNRFSGNVFLNEKATKQVFTTAAKEHKIIHIGTHAESNNVNPELSRLVFAKNIHDATNGEDNYLYSYEIYDYDLSSDLAILTACETGKPTYQPGEGMISLAHAFNYAGSKSILTSLWEIDEQSSTEIVASFYKNLADGKPKDLALRNAKLDYLLKAEGRTLHPQYWGGLVIMGDPGTVSISSPTNWWLWIIILIVLFLTIYLVLSKKRNKI